ncbi:MAG: hypothetical protein PHD01_13410 [Geobacteraceae bacterium]|nr:hypothetical protein [Geobacteraceae bacterium]
MNLPLLCEQIKRATREIQDKNVAVNKVSHDSGHGHLYYYSAQKFTEYRVEIENNCCNSDASFSVQDQYAAGCSANDTLSVCMEKLTKNCIRKVGQKKQIKEYVSEKQGPLNEMHDKTGQLVNEVKHFMAILP